MLSRQTASVTTERTALADVPMREALTVEQRPDARTMRVRLVSALAPWLPALVVALATWATWQLGLWLLERWQVH